MATADQERVLSVGAAFGLPVYAPKPRPSLRERLIRFIAARFDLVPRSAIAEYETAVAVAWAVVDEERHHRKSAEHLYREMEKFVLELRGVPGSRR